MASVVYSEADRARVLALYCSSEPGLVQLELETQPSPQSLGSIESTQQAAGTVTTHQVLVKSGDGVF